MAPTILREPAAVSAWAESARREGARVGLVPTLGFLHRGHLSLMEACRERAYRTVVSIFVNPTQFGPGEDLSRYPRDLPGDQRKLEAEGVDILYMPSVEDVYPAGYQTFIKVEEIGARLDGASRPGHFRGVATGGDVSVGS